MIHNNKIYEQVFYDNEDHFEQIVKKQLSQTLEQFIVLDFKIFVLGDEGIRRKPDLALVHRRHMMWAVVEVELEHHSLNFHVFPQMQALASGFYDITHATYMAENSDEIDLDKAKYLVNFIPPEVMILVNSRSVLNKGWSILESDLNVRLTYLEVFRSNAGDAIFSLSGYTPEVSPRRIAGAKKHPMLNALVCGEPSALPVSSSAQFQMQFKERPIYWQVLMTSDTAMLFPKPSVTLRDDRNYEILKSEDGRLVLRSL